MRKVLMVLVVALAIGTAAYMAYAQASSQVDDKGYIDIGSYTETATKKRPAGSLYRGSGILTYVGRPPKPYLQHDMGGYELDPAPAADRNKPYNKRDLSHTWEFIASSPGKPVRLTAKGREMRRTHITSNESAALGVPTNDPELMCDPIGYPGITERGTRPFEFFQLPSVTLYHSAWHDTWQKIWTDGRLLPKAPLDPAWIGYSVGKWVGDTFVVDTNGVDERAWSQGSNYQSPEAEFQARWRRIDNNTLQLNKTIKDPTIWEDTINTQPTLFQRYPNLEIDILPCVPSEELLYKSNTPTETPNPVPNASR